MSGHSLASVVFPAPSGAQTMSVEHSSPCRCAPDNGALHVWSALQNMSSLLPSRCPTSTSLLSSLHGAQVLIPYTHREMTLQNGGGLAPLSRRSWWTRKKTFLMAAAGVRPSGSRQWPPLGGERAWVCLNPITQATCGEGDKATHSQGYKA